MNLYIYFDFFTHKLLIHMLLFKTKPTYTIKINKTVLIQNYIFISFTSINNTFMMRTFNICLIELDNTFINESIVYIYKYILTFHP